jgi:hypothetical protein
MLKGEDLQVGHVVRLRSGGPDMRVCTGRVIECMFTERADNGIIELYPLTSLDAVGVVESTQNEAPNPQG